MVFDLTKIPNWLIGLGILAIGVAAVWVFVFPGKGIEWGGSYFGPPRTYLHLGTDSDVAKIPFTAQRFGGQGAIGEKAVSSTVSTVIDYGSAQDGTQVVTEREYPICAISGVTNAVGGGGHCELIRDDGYWKIHSSGTTSCKVTCFKVEAAK